MFTNYIIALGENILSLLDQMLFHPLSTIFSITLGYLSQMQFHPISIIGVLIAFFLFSQAVRIVWILIKAGISYAILYRKEKKRKERILIQQKERKRTEDRIAYDKQFDELYDTYVL